VLGRHAAHRLARAQETASDIGRHDAIDSLGIHLLDPHLTRQDAGVIDERCKPAKSLVYHREHAFNGGLIGDVGLYRQRGPADVLNGGDDVGGRNCIASVIYANFVPLFGGKQRARRANAASPASDQNYFIHDEISSLR
jgi:hypothetical protein